MKHKEMKKKVLGLIEELNPSSEMLTDDPDIEAKYIEVCNQVMFELARMKKIPVYAQMRVSAGDIVTMAIMEKAVGHSIYQIAAAEGVAYANKASGTVLKIRETGTLELDVFVYPERITEANASRYEFELSQDVLEIMPYGVAADLLKSDASADYGKEYQKRYEGMLERLDPRFSITSIVVEGGVRI